MTGDEREDAADDADQPPAETTGQQAPPMGGGRTEIPAAAQKIQGVWGDLIADLEATATEYRADGWEVVAVHPGDVTALEGREASRWGLDVLVADNEWKEIEALVEADSDFDSVEVYRAEANGLLVAVVSLLNEDAEAAVLYPVYYDLAADSAMVDKATQEGVMQTHLRPLDERQIYTFEHEDVELFLPESDQ